MNKQVILGISLMIFGGAMIMALATSPKDDKNTQTHEITGEIARPVVEPLTADIETETRLLEQKRKQREAQVARLEEETKTLLIAQEQARNKAIKKQREEAVLTSVQTRPESIELAKKKEAQARQKQAEQRQAEKQKQAQLAESQAEKQKQDDIINAKKTGKYTVQAGDNLIRLAKEYGISVSVLAKANDLSDDATLHKGKVLKIPTSAQIKALQADVKAQEQKAAADARLREARQNTSKSANKGTYAVQVALAVNQEKADELAKKFKAQGYRVKTTPDRRGVKVIIGPERSKEAADALRTKISHDKSVGAMNAWVYEVKE